MNTLADFNGLEQEAALNAALAWCHCREWAAEVVSRRPFHDVERLQRTCVAQWQQASAAQIHEALAAHPLIGDVELLRSKYSVPEVATENDALDTAFAEQGQVLQASSETLAELARLNVEYRARHGFIFIIFAKHLSAEQMLDAIRRRINNDTQDEFSCAAAQQTKILLARIATTFNADC